MSTDASETAATGLRSLQADALSLANQLQALQHPVWRVPAVQTASLQVVHQTAASPAEVLAVLQAWSGQPGCAGWVEFSGGTTALPLGAWPAGIPLNAELCLPQRSLSLRHDNAQWLLATLSESDGEDYAVWERRHLSANPAVGAWVYRLYGALSPSGQLTPQFCRLARTETPHR